MKETESLLKRSERYLKSAALLLNDGGYESAVSRVYYAMFYATQAVLLTKKLSFSSHKSV
ncbi:MAG: HEPN domain-containing protein, partial [Anaerolineae bacterium]|nr:HEPN domain-containing protein [Anaerolineae bacterium]